METRMKILCMTAWSLLSAASGAVGQDVETWLISGQSNACGTAPLPGAPVTKQVTVFDAVSRGWVPAEEPLGLPTKIGVGPWLTAATEVTTAGTRTIRICGYAVGGTRIDRWDDGGPGLTGLEAEITKVDRKVDVFLWYQGESDGLEGTEPDVYSKKLEHLIHWVRAACAKPELPVVIVQLASERVGKSFAGIREAQRAVVAADPHAILVPALGCEMKDSLHLSREGYFQVGRAVGRALLRRRGFKQASDWAGPVMDQAVLAADGKTIAVHFAEVQSLKGALPKDFGILLPDGTSIPCAISQSGQTRLVLKADGSVKLPAKLAYGIGIFPEGKLTDEHGNHAPAVIMDLVLGPALEDTPTEAPNGAAAPKAEKRRGASR
jgi:hypothetical protein